MIFLFQSSSEQHASQTFGCWYCTSSPISASLKIRHSGYTPGQKIRIYGEIENNTGRNTKKANVRLMQVRMMLQF